jgi:competence protein ComEC
MTARYPLAAAAIGLWVGTWLGLALGLRAEVGVLTATFVAVLAWPKVIPARMKQWKVQAAALLLAAVFGALLGAMRLAPLANQTVATWARYRLPVNAVVVVSGEATSVTGYTHGSYRRPDGWRVAATLIHLSTTQGRALDLRIPVELRGTKAVPRFIPGTELAVTGSLAPGVITRGVSCQVRAKTWTVERGPPLWQRAVAQVRGDLVRASQVLPGDARGLFPGLTLGDTRAVPDDLTTAMKATGLTHLTAVSGGNLAVTLAIVLAAVRWLRWSRRAQVAVAGCTLSVFVVLVHAEPSVLRAAVMASLALVGFLLERPRAAIAGLFGSIALLLLIDPWLARSWGFALSAAATGGLLALAGALTTYFSRWLPHALSAAVAVALAAQFATAPLVSALAGGVPLASVPANVLAVPAAGPATAFGLVAAVLASVWPPLALVPTLLGGAAAWWIAFVARTIASWSLPVVHLGTGFVAALTSVCLIAVGVGVWRWWPQLQTHIPVGVRNHRRAIVAAVALLGVTAGFALGPVLKILDGWPPKNWAIVACDVGQGDALVLATSPGRAVVVDAGPDPRPINRCLADLGIRHIDFIVLTHFHADHVEGIEGILKKRDVGYIVVTGLVDPPDEASRVQQWTMLAHVPIRTIEPGWSGVDGSLTWQTLWPLRYLKGQGSDPNNASIVLLVRNLGVSILLTGDVEPAAQHAIESSWLGPHVDVFKVPHHGSSHQALEFGTWSGAHIALISVGRGNPYGHPAAGTIAQLRADHMAVGRTDLEGDLAVVMTANGPALVRRRRTAMARCRT